MPAYPAKPRKVEEPKVVTPPTQPPKAEKDSK